MLLRKPLLPGRDYLDQLKLIIKTLGSPSGSSLDFITAPKARAYIEGLPKSPKPDLRRTLGKGFSSDAVDLVEKMLRFDPRERISVDEALKHPWLKTLHDPTTEKTYVAYMFPLLCVARILKYPRSSRLSAHRFFLARRQILQVPQREV